MDNQDLQALLQDLDPKTWIQCSISSPKTKQEMLKANIRTVKIGQRTVLQLSEFRKEKVFHRNLSYAEVVAYLLEHIQAFKQIIIQTTNGDHHILSNKKGQLTIVSKKNQRSLQMIDHNRQKNRILQEKTAHPFLVELGVMDINGHVKNNARDKFVQVNRFLETIQDIIPHLPKDKKIHVIDFGCGSAILTFALYHYLYEHLKLDVEMVGLDLKDDVISKCQQLAKKLGYSNLKFFVQDIHTYNTSNPVDLVISLHACDTATDAVLERAIKWKVPVILAVPCCQKEVFKQIACNELKPLLKHGILKERFAALVTDAARAQLLTMHGYHTQVMEFIDMEHTPKNIMIRAIKHNEKVPEQATEEYRAFADMLGTCVMLESRLKIQCKERKAVEEDLKTS